MNNGPLGLSVGCCRFAYSNLEHHPRRREDSAPEQIGPLSNDSQIQNQNDRYSLAEKFLDFCIRCNEITLVLGRLDLFQDELQRLCAHTAKLNRDQLKPAWFLVAMDLVSGTKPDAQIE